ncbi:unnamed protein product [Linum trigynum]|uniref:Uncharacterized protein n=1 Tax=Linum trigynum TaxID=586398 RepID=A0AAV2ED82_9ROSI
MRKRSRPVRRSRNKSKQAKELNRQNFTVSYLSRGLELPRVKSILTVLTAISSSLSVTSLDLCFEQAADVG